MSLFNTYLEQAQEDKLDKKTIFTLWDGTKICVVNGDFVRDEYDEDFLKGGHGYVYTFIPKDEIWIEKDVVDEDEKELLTHELTEWYQMKYDNKKYKEAHKHSESFEAALREIDKLHRG